MENKNNQNAEWHCLFFKLAYAIFTKGGYLKNRSHYLQLSSENNGSSFQTDF